METVNKLNKVKRYASFRDSGTVINVGGKNCHLHEWRMHEALTDRDFEACALLVLH